MDERLALPATFDCTRLRARVTEKGCARLWRSANEKPNAPQPWESRAACLGCAVGSLHALGSLEPARQAALARQVAEVCVTCGSSGRRMVKQTHCVSCYNRLREAAIGRDARGRPPALMRRLFAVGLVVGRPDATPALRMCQGVTSRAEAILTMAKQAASVAIVIGWPRLVDLPPGCQPELSLEAPRVSPPRPPRPPALPVSCLEVAFAAA
jgi:hypothetical protein